MELIVFFIIIVIFLYITEKIEYWWTTRKPPMENGKRVARIRRNFFGGPTEIWFANKEEEDYHYQESQKQLEEMDKAILKAIKENPDIVIKDKSKNE